MTIQLPSFYADRLAGAWRDYQRVQRSTWVSAPHIERRYLRSQDLAAYQSERRLLLQQCDGAVRRWIAACRKSIDRRVLVEPVGRFRDLGGMGMPSCFLVRVPKRGDLAMSEHVFGQPMVSDGEGARYIRELQAKERSRQRAAQQDARVQRFYGRMVKALGRARAQMAVKAAARLDVRNTPPDSPEQVRARLRANNAHALGSRAWISARKMQARLAKLGYSYDLDTLDTGPAPG